MMEGSRARNGMIKRCIFSGTDSVARLREQYNADKNNIKLQQLRKEQATVSGWFMLNTRFSNLVIDVQFW